MALPNGAEPIAMTPQNAATLTEIIRLWPDLKAAFLRSEEAQRDEKLQWEFATPVRVKLDPATASLTGGATTPCGYKYFAYTLGANVANSQEVPLSPVSLAPEFPVRTSIGRYTAAQDGSVGFAYYDFGANAWRLWACTEQPFAEPC